MSLSASTQETIQKTLDATTTPSAGTGVPGLVFCAIDKSGKFLTQTASGTHGIDNKTPMSMDSVFYIASCTKMITGIACMQLQEQGKLDLDSHEKLYQICPELKEKKVLQKDGSFVDKQHEITLRMLLTHTAGFGYTFFNTKLRDYSRPAGFNEFAGDERDYLMQPLVNQPGSRWEYGINIDWAGIAVERVSGMKLDAYFKKFIFEPLGIKNISFLPSQHMRDNLVTMQQRMGDKTIDDDQVARRNIFHADDKDTNKLFHAGGAGCFAKPSEYCQILTTLLNDGTSPTTKAKILSKASVDEMFTNQIPQFPQYGNRGIEAAKPAYTNPLPALYPQEGNPPQGWGLTFMMTIEPGVTGRGRNTGWWAGIVNLFWWVDREKGVAGMIAGQILPFGDPAVMGAWFGCEAAVYNGLK